MSNLTITRTAETAFDVQSGPNTYHITRNPRWQCDCPARGICKHLRTALSCFGLAIGGSVTIGANTDSSGDDGMLSGPEFDAEAGCDVCEEINYIRSGREKRNMGC